MSIARVFLLPVLALALAALPPRRVSAEPIEKILIPVYADEAPGVNGSLWTTDLWVSNSGDSFATARGIVWDCLLPECYLPAPLPPEITIRTAPLAIEGMRGTLVSIEADHPEQTGFGMRFRDLSRQATTWGTELLVPRQGAFRSSRFSIIDVPVTEGFRQTLRIYELDGTPREALVRVRLFRLDANRHWVSEGPDELLGEAVRTLSFTPAADDLIEYPGYAEISDLTVIDPLDGAERIRVEIEPVTEGLRLWAFVTVVHNESQHATVISPQ
jgi:hypothetical protein